jgi:hypothetical protein
MNTKITITQAARILIFLPAIGAMLDRFPSIASASPSASSPAQAAEGQHALTRRIGAIKAINGTTITLAPDSGPEIAVTVQPGARLLRIVPGEKDLKNATPFQLQELQVGDTIRVRGIAADDAKSMTGLEVLVITRAAVQAVSEQIRLDWQKRGLGGLVSSVEPATGTVTISVTGFGGTKNIAIHTSKTTVFRRYAPDSIKFEDAKASTLPDVQPGDQLRARGTRGADGTEFTADEIVTGNFRNIAGLVNSVDVAAGMLNVQDVLSKKAVLVKITADSQLHKIPIEAAQRIALRLKGAMPPGMPGAGASSSTSTAPPAANGQAPPSVGMGPGGGGGGLRSGGAPDLQQMLSRMPAVALADLHKGDAVMMVATQGTPAGAGTAITLLSGVEPILQAAPNGSQAMMLSPWSLGGAPGGDAGSQ